MKNHLAQVGSTITLDNNGELTTVDLYSKEGLDMLSNLWIKAATQHRLMYQPLWLGRPIIQFPTDIVAVQELIWSVQPDVIVETGVAHGGSLVLSASILQLIGKGKVIGVDIEVRPHNRDAIESHPLSHRIELIEGSSISRDTFGSVVTAVGAAETVMVMLDSNHSEPHVLEELRMYSTLVTSGSFIVAHDGAQAWVSDIPRAVREWQGSHPLGAIEKFLEENRSFVSDPHWTRLGITCSPHGWLKKVA